MSKYSPVRQQTTLGLNNEGSTVKGCTSDTTGANSTFGDDRELNSARHKGIAGTTNDNTTGSVSYANQNTAGPSSHPGAGTTSYRHYHDAQDNTITPAEPRRESLSLNHEHAPREEIEP